MKLGEFIAIIVFGIISSAFIGGLAGYYFSIDPHYEIKMEYASLHADIAQLQSEVAQLKGEINSTDAYVNSVIKESRP